VTCLCATCPQPAAYRFDFTDTEPECGLPGWAGLCVRCTAVARLFYAAFHPAFVYSVRPLVPEDGQCWRTWSARIADDLTGPGHT
jgi:hypothetical protein